MPDTLTAAPPDALADALTDLQWRDVFTWAKAGHRLPHPEDFSPPIDAGPESLACPECGGRLSVEVFEWDEETGFPTGEAGMHVSCAEEDEREERDRRYRSDHYSSQGDWMPVDAAVAVWVTRECYQRLKAMAEKGGPG